MSHTVIDRRKNDKGKSTDNRRRFMRRVKQQVRDAVKDAIRDGNVRDITSDKGKKISIPGKGLEQPTFSHDKKGGIVDRTYPGNDKYNQGDRVSRPPEADGGGGKKGSPDGEGEDEFIFHLTKDEFLDIFFEDLELPDLVKKDISKVNEFEYHRAGFSVDGNPSRMNIVRSLKQAKARKLGLRSPFKKKIKKLEEELASLEDSLPTNDEEQDTKIICRIEEIKKEIEVLKRKMKAVPFIDDVDLRFNRWEKTPVPTTQAVMFGIMDVSASMGEWEKEMAKRFFMLLYLFLERNYEKVDIVWIRHHTRASEVSEEEFFYSKETGGTLVSSALELMSDIIKERYPINQWNIFGCQISDGDNWGQDNLEVIDIMKSSILPKSQFFAYVEVDRHQHEGESDLWPYYEKLRSSFGHFEMSMINDVSDIYPIFRSLFEKKA